MDIWLVLGPVLALGFSMLFTVWYTRRLRRAGEDGKGRRQYLEDVDQFATQLIRICDSTRASVSDEEWARLLPYKESLEKNARELIDDNPFGDVLLESLRDTTRILKTIHGDRRYDMEKISRLRKCCEKVKDTVFDLRDRQ